MTVDQVPKDKRGFALVMYKLRHIPDVFTSHPFTKGVSLSYRDMYSVEKLKFICDGLKWALANKDFDFKNLLPDADIRHSNEEIIYFLEKTYNGMKEFGICENCSDSD